MDSHALLVNVSLSHGLYDEAATLLGRSMALIMDLADRVKLYGLEGRSTEIRALAPVCCESTSVGPWTNSFVCTDRTRDSKRI